MHICTNMNAQKIWKSDLPILANFINLFRFCHIEQLVWSQEEYRNNHIDELDATFPLFICNAWTDIPDSNYSSLNCCNWLIFPFYTSERFLNCRKKRSNSQIFNTNRLNTKNKIVLLVASISPERMLNCLWSSTSSRSHIYTLGKSVAMRGSQHCGTLTAMTTL